MSVKKEAASSSHIIAGDEFKHDFTPPQWGGYKTKSDEIRARAASGQTRSTIAKEMGIRYQHVRNVLTYEVKRK